MDIYQGDYFSGAEGGFGYSDYDADKVPMIPTFEVYLNRIAHFQPPDGARRLLDVGAATGFFLDLARKRGWCTVGVEPSEEAAQRGRNKGLDVRTGILEPGLFEPASFDVITMWDVIEHVPDPSSVLHTAKELLKPGGILAINTPDSGSLYARVLGAKWHLLCLPEHLCLFSVDAMKRMLQSTGLEVVESDKIGKSFTLQYVIQTLAHWMRVRALDRLYRGLQGSSLGLVEIPINLRDNLFMLARKP